MFQLTRLANVQRLSAPTTTALSLSEFATNKKVTKSQSHKVISYENTFIIFHYGDYYPLQRNR